MTSHQCYSEMTLKETPLSEDLLYSIKTDKHKRDVFTALDQVYFILRMQGFKLAFVIF